MAPPSRSLLHAYPTDTGQASLDSRSFGTSPRLFTYADRINGGRQTKLNF